MDGNGSVRMALQLREQFDTPAAMFAALKADMELSDDVASKVAALTVDHDPPDGLAWLAAVFFAAGRLDRTDPDLRARLFAVYCRSAGRIRSAI
jgi:hypothetical protein